MEPDEHDHRDDSDTEGQRVQALDERFGRIEHEQSEQRGILEQIRNSLGSAKGAERQAHAAAQAHTQDRLEHPPAATIADQVRAAVADVDAERENKRRQAEHDDHHKRLREQAEQAPRETASGWRGKLAKAMYGGDG